MAASEPRAPAKNQSTATAADVRVWRPSRKNSGPGGRIRNERCTPFPHAARTAGDGISVRRSPEAPWLSLSAAGNGERALSLPRWEEAQGRRGVRALSVRSSLPSGMGSIRRRRKRSGGLPVSVLVRAASGFGERSVMSSRRRGRLRLLSHRRLALPPVAQEAP